MNLSVICLSLRRQIPYILFQRDLTTYIPHRSALNIPKIRIRNDSDTALTLQPYLALLIEVGISGIFDLNMEFYGFPAKISFRKIAIPNTKPVTQMCPDIIISGSPEKDSFLRTFLCFPILNREYN